jgi:hypothetical protein
MRIIRAMLLGSAAIAAVTGAAMADGTVDVDQLASQAAPMAPSTWLMTISKTPHLEVPGLPMSTKELKREGDRATTLRIIPATDAPANGAVSWSGYTRSGTVYRGSN